MPAAAIRLSQIVKRYEEGSSSVTAVAGVDLSLESGRLTALMGPSGSGKTTLLSIMGCLLSASSGEVEIAGATTVGLDQEARAKLRAAHIGFVFQHYNLFPTLTAGENVALALELKGIGGSLARQARALLAEVGIEDKDASFPADLSGGQRQRVAIARALAGDPRIVLADEPTGALDRASGERIMRIFRRLADDHGRAVAIVTHDPRMLEFADRVVEMEDGRVVADGPPRRG